MMRLIAICKRARVHKQTKSICDTIKNAFLQAAIFSDPFTQINMKFNAFYGQADDKFTFTFTSLDVPSATPVHNVYHVHPSDFRLLSSIPQFLTNI